MGVSVSAMNINSPTDRATELAKKALVEIKLVDTMCACLGEDPTGLQELSISTAIRQYFIEKTKARHLETCASIDRGLAMIKEQPTMEPTT
jgi:hypothetical protein